MRIVVFMTVVAACQGPAAPRVHVAGVVSGSDGSEITTQPFVHLQVDGSDVATTFASAAGTYEMTVDVPPGTRYATVVVDLTSSRVAVYAPQMANLRIDPAIAEYRLDLQMSPATFRALSTTSTTDVAVVASGQPVHVVFPRATTPDVYGVVAVVDVANAPGSMRPTAQPGQSLQSNGMFYIDAFDSHFERHPVTGTTIQLGAAMPPAIPDSDVFRSWQMNGMGDWDSTGELPMTAAAPPSFTADQFGFWNADRAFRTACVTGTLAGGGADCVGAAMSAVGPDNLVSRDTSDSRGRFCVEGAQGRTSMLTVGAMTKSVTMPSTPGDCTQIASCSDIGTVSAPAKSCGKLDMEGGAGACDPHGAGVVCNAILSCRLCSIQDCATRAGCGFYLASDGRTFGTECYGSSTSECLTSAANAVLAYCDC